MNKTLRPALAALALALGCLSSTAALAAVAVSSPAPTKIFDSNHSLIGLNGVTVLGQQYDVRFVGAGQNCQQAFTGCDSLGDFTFNAPGAGAASQALAAATGFFDYTSLGLSNGVIILTPFALQANLITTLNTVLVSQAQFQFGIAGPTASVSMGSLSSDQILRSPPAALERFAVWSPAAIAPAVPEPGTYALMLAGLGVVGSIARRRRGA